MSLTHKSAVNPSPVPSLAHPDLGSVEKFLAAAKGAGQDPAPWLDWAIHVLLNSLMADSASRMFLPKTETAPFQAEDFFPFSAVKPAGRQMVELARCFVIAPIWNNAEAIAAMEQVRAAVPAGKEAGGMAVGWYIPEINLAVVGGEVHRAYFSRFYGGGSALLSLYRLKELADHVSTDGENWYVKEQDGSETWCPVLEPRMAVLYQLALKRHFGRQIGGSK